MSQQKNPVRCNKEPEMAKNKKILKIQFVKFTYLELFMDSAVPNLKTP